MYSPLQLTHQGVYPQYPAGVNYPTARWNKARLIKTLQPVRDFQVKNKARIFMNEFSISTFADVNSRVNYLTDVISIAQKYGWHWCYHAWRESLVWNAENEPRVLKVLTDQFKKNVL